MELIIFVIWIFVIISIVKSASKSSNNAQNNQKLLEVRAQRYDVLINRDRYSSIDKLARDMGINRALVISDLKTLISNGRLKNIQVDEVNGVIRYLDGSSHDHAYKHKVQPTVQATVVKNQQEAMQKASNQSTGQMTMSLDKQEEDTVASWDDSISDRLAEYRVENIKKKSRTSSYSLSVGRNGDNGYIPQGNEESVACGYCGALNILPRNRSGEYTCYFCREKL